MQHSATCGRKASMPGERSCDGLATLRLRRAVTRQVNRTLNEARRLNTADLDAGKGLSRLVTDAGLIEAALATDSVRSLPARHGVTRLERIMGDLLRGGDIALSEEALTEALKSRPLTLRELWAVPCALRIAVAEGLSQVCAGIVRTAQDCLAAERWIAHPRRHPRAVSPDFIEHAMRRCGEDNLTVLRVRLESRLHKFGISINQAIRQAHDARAHLELRLDNLLNALRLLDSIDWQSCFESLSEVDAELRRDPAGLYSQMDDASRKRILEQVSILSRATSRSEDTIARHAVHAARQYAESISEKRPDSEYCDIKPETSCCWWLYDDAGRAELLKRMACPRIQLDRLIPDPHGARCVITSLLLSAAIARILWRWLELPWLLPACLPAGWTAAAALINRLFPRLQRPAKLLKMDFERLPDTCRTLVVTPVLLTDARHVDAACDNLEALGCLEDDPNLAFLLLGDFADADRADMPGDDAILRRARERIAVMNRRAGCEKYYYLHRRRTLLAADGRYMGRDRKRGALEDLNRMLSGGASGFDAEGAACEVLRKKYAFVLTLDADTRMLPGTAHRLAGTLAHPLNRRYVVLQPRMETAPSSVTSRFSWLFSGVGGLDIYPTHASSLWMDMTGVGLYGGKGIYRVSDFLRATEDALPEGRVLSHDLIEGALSGTGFVSDIALYDGCPATLSGWMRRQHRWIRGDWQLLPLIFSIRRLRAADRFRMLDNLMRSLRAPSLWLFFAASAWTGRMEGAAAAMLLLFLPALLDPLESKNWLRCVADLASLPLTARCMADAAARALWRVFVSGKHLMDWVPSADAERMATPSGFGEKMGTLVLLPGLLNARSLPLTLALFMVFWVGADWIRDMECQPIDDAPPLTSAQADQLRALARDTWRFFAENVSPEGPALPPDNVQLDPPVGAARRTSPTNIGLYLLSCASAMSLGFIDREAFHRRVSATLDAIDATEKWRGHLYNWIDIDTLAPLPPKYVSAVDSGNLAACALACARYVTDETLANRLNALAEGMDFTALYDESRHLFRIGVDVDGGRPSASHYDLLASESRILSYVALMLGQVPMKHWTRLGRRCVDAGGGATLLSWSGTMFEYLMPELLMPAPPLSLLGGSARHATRAQMAVGAPWGISESGYHAFDAHMNYQYRAFGLKTLALAGQDAADGGVIAPYASALALAVAPRGAAENLEQMSRLGWRDHQGFYEAADALRPNPDGSPALVKSHMAHHQGMTLCAICNALTDGGLAQAFMADPRARALSLLLEERTPRKVKRRAQPMAVKDHPVPAAIHRVARDALDAHLLRGSRSYVLVTGDGAIHYSRDGFDATRFYGDLTDRPEAANIHLSVNGTSWNAPLVCRFDAGSTSFEGTATGLAMTMTLSLSPEDDTLFRSIEIQNKSTRPMRVEITDAVPVALAKPRDFLAHPAFQLLFVEAEALGDHGLRFRRRPRNPGEESPSLVHTVFSKGIVLRETRRDRVFDREGRMRPELTGVAKTPIDPVSALRVDVTLSPGCMEYLCFALKLCDPGDTALPRCLPDRAALLSRARTEAMLGFLGISPGMYHRLDRMSALLLEPELASRAKADHRPSEGTSREALWSMGISGDIPMITMNVDDASQVETAQAMIKAQSFYRAMRLETDLVLVDLGPDGYDRPVHAMLQGLIDASALRDQSHVLIVSHPTAEGIDVLKRASAVCLNAKAPFSAQVGALLAALPLPDKFPILHPGASVMPRPARQMDNGYGGFAGDGGYEIDVAPGHVPPAPWCNILATDGMGLLLTDRGGGFIWYGNSRFCRLTDFGGDPAQERFGLSLEMVSQSGEHLSLLPARRPIMQYRVKYTPDAIEYSFQAKRAAARVCFTVTDSAALIDLWLDLRRLNGTVRLEVHWLMGESRKDASWLRIWSADGSLFASGASPGVGWLAADCPETECDGGLSVPVSDGKNHIRFALGWAKDIDEARQLARSARDGTLPQPVPSISDALIVDTPDCALNRMMNTFLPHQVRASRICGRTGFYQPGGAYGFRDQLQDMLALIPLDPERVRRHLLMCAGRQFAAGDVLHWWHMPYLGVRTRIRDDRLFLPWTTAEYIRQTGDVAVLEETIPYLADTPIPEDREDVFQAMTPGAESGTLHDHCMRAFRASDAVGAHGLALMGTGDWNDGMNRVGPLGKGESVWLSEFIAACAENYAEICPMEADANWLRALARRHRGAVELYGWDGRWYLRAFMDDGMTLGSAKSEACRIDLISQAWAPLSGLSPERCKMAIDSAWDKLVDDKKNLIRLLAPPFDAEGPDPGYIRGYPPGIRENGAQYTHAACWLLLALARMNDANRAHQALRMLLPPYRADTQEKADAYRVEPFVMAADIYDLPGEPGRGGWTWYTGSAAWLYVAVLALLGYDRKGDRVRLNALLGPWPRASLSLRHGNSRYRLVCDPAAKRVLLDGRPVGEDFITLVDDGQSHEALFPPRI